MRHLVAERHGDFAGDEERILLHGFGGTDQPFIGRRQHGVGEVGGLDAGQRHLDLALDDDLAAGDAEVEIGRGVDARLGHVDDAQVFAVHADFAVGRLSRHSSLPELVSVPAPALALELNSRLLETMRASMSSARSARLSW